MSEDSEPHGFSDEDARRIARLLLRELQMAPPNGPSDEMLAWRHQLPDVDEDRVEEALVKLGAVDREVTAPVHRDADRPRRMATEE